MSRNSSKRPSAGGVGAAPTRVKFEPPGMGSPSPFDLPLDQIQKRAQAYLDEQGFLPGRFVGKEEESNWQNLTEGCSDDLKRAYYILKCCQQLPILIKHGEAKGAASHSFRLATLLADSHVTREWAKVAPIIEHGNTMLQGESNIPKANQKRAREREPEWRRYKEEYAEKIGVKHPTWKKGRIAQEIFDRLDPPPEGKGQIKDSSVIKRIKRHV